MIRLASFVSCAFIDFSIKCIIYTDLPWLWCVSSNSLYLLPRWVFVYQAPPLPVLWGEVLIFPYFFFFWFDYILSYFYFLFGSLLIIFLLFLPPWGRSFLPSFSFGCFYVCWLTDCCIVWDKVSLSLISGLQVCTPTSGFQWEVKHSPYCCCTGGNSLFPWCYVFPCLLF